MLDRTAMLAEEDFTTAFLRDPASTIAGMAAEHILLDTGEPDEPSDQFVEPGSVRERVTFDNRVRGITTELAFLDNGFVGVSVKRRRGDDQDYTIDLRYLDPRPVLLKTTPTSARKLTTSLAGAGLAGGALAYLTASWMVSLSAIGLAAAVLLAWLIYQRYERVVFLTRHGRAATLTLYASFGCARDCRTLVPKIVAAIRESQQRLGPADNRRLREEIREHYRLRDHEVLTGEDCTTAARRILSHFSDSRPAAA